jgi:hypothetical protein
MKTFFFTCILILAASLDGRGQSQLATHAPTAQTIQGIISKTSWLADGPLRTLDPPGFEKLDPNRATIMAEYGFSQVTIQALKNGNSSILLEIFEMLDFSAAYGAFTFYRAPDSKTSEAPGNLAASGKNNLSFIQNKYYVRLGEIGSDSIPDPKPIAEIISKSLPHGLLLPPLLGRLPEKGHIKNSTIYSMGPETLNQILHGSGKDIFGMSNGAEAIWASYQEGEQNAHLLLLNYPTQQLARQYLDRGNKELSGLFPDMNVLYKREGPLITMVISRSDSLANQLLDRVNYVSSVSWDPKTHPLTVVRLFLNVFLFIGITLLFTLGGGLLFGITRIVARRFFPGRIFDRPGSELIHLDLQRPFRRGGNDREQ